MRIMTCAHKGTARRSTGRQALTLPPAPRSLGGEARGGEGGFRGFHWVQGSEGCTLWCLGTVLELKDVQRLKGVCLGGFCHCSFLFAIRSTFISFLGQCCHDPCLLKGPDYSVTSVCWRVRCRKRMAQAWRNNSVVEQVEGGAVVAGPPPPECG